MARPDAFAYNLRMDTSILETVARATRLREGPEGVAAVLRAVYRAGSLRLQDAALATAANSSRTSAITAIANGGFQRVLIPFPPCL